MNLEDLDAAPPARLPFPVTRAVADSIEIRATEAGDAATPPTMVGHFSTFNDWYEVNSHLEGHFLERVAPGAFRKTIAESRGSMKVLFNHGNDATMGNQVLGAIDDLREDSTGPAYAVGLFDGVPPLIVSGLRAGAYGSSHRFTAEKDVWDHSPSRSAYNPEGLPERTITEARVFEFGPVTFPADPKATAGIRSTTDDFYQRSRDAESFESLLRSAQSARTPIPVGAAAKAPEPPPDTREPEPSRSDTPPAPVNTQGPLRSGSLDSRKESDPVNEYITRDDKAARVVELEASISRRAVEFPGVLPEDVQATDESEIEERSRLVADIAAWDARQDRIRSFSTQPARTEATYAAPTIVRKQSIEDIHDLSRIRNETRSRDEFDAKVRENALRSIDSARFSPGAKPDALVDIIANRDSGEEGEGEISRRVLLTGNPVYRRAFNKYLRGERDLWSPEEARAAALAVTGTTTTGGYAVPYIFDPTIIRVGSYTANNPFRQACRVETISNGNNWRTVTVGAVTTAYITEAGAATEQGPTFAQPTYTVQSAHAFATVSHETLQDRPDIGDELGAVFAESKATYEENQFAIGVGTTVFPLGMFADTAYTNQDTATDNVTALLDFSVVEGAVPLRFRQNAAWFMARSTIRQLQILDTTYRYFSGSGIQFPGPSNLTTGLQMGSTAGGNTGLFLLGYPIWEVPSAVSTLTTDGAIIAVLCDPKTYIIVDRLGMSIEVIPNMLNGATPSFPTGQRGIYARFRNTAKPLTATGGISLSVQ